MVGVIVRLLGVASYVEYFMLEDVHSLVKLLHMLRCF